VRPRTQASLAVSGNGTDWVLLNASPDLPQQIRRPQVAVSALRYPRQPYKVGRALTRIRSHKMSVRGVVFTDRRHGIGRSKWIPEQIPAALAFCGAHWRRRFYEIAKGGPAPIAQEALARIAALYAIEKRIPFFVAMSLWKNLSNLAVFQGRQRDAPP
jgi:hypothetical protein